MAESPPISDFSTDNRLADPWDRPSRELGVPGRSPAYGQLPQTGPDDVGTRGDAAYLPAHCLVARVLRGYSLLLWPLVHAGITTAFAMAGPALWAVGEANEHGAAERAILDIAALTSLIPVALQIAYLPTLYSACIHRETKVALLNARPGCPHGAQNYSPAPTTGWAQASPTLVRFRSPELLASWHDDHSTARPHGMCQAARRSSDRLDWARCRPSSFIVQTKDFTPTEKEDGG